MTDSSVWGSARIAGIRVKRTPSQGLITRARKGASICLVYSNYAQNKSPMRLKGRPCNLWRARREADNQLRRSEDPPS